MNWTEGLRRGRSHVIFVIVLAIGGATVVQIENDTLEAETGARPAARADVPALALPSQMATRSTTPTSKRAAAVTATPDKEAPVTQRPAAAARQDGPALLVQAGAFATRAGAQRAGERMQRVVSPSGGGAAPSIEPYRRVYRVRFAAADQPTARAICDRLKASGDPCWIVER